MKNLINQMVTANGMAAL
jgi:hypothetical protein